MNGTEVYLNLGLRFCVDCRDAAKVALRRWASNAPVPERRVPFGRRVKA